VSEQAGVLFDFGGTLDADGLPWAARFYSAYRAAGGSASFATFEPLFKVSDRALERLPAIRTLGFQAMAQAQARLLCELVPDGAALAPERVAERFHADSVAVVTRNRPLLERLRRAYRLGIVSNFTGNLELCLTELGLLELFAAVADSALLGVAKPDRRIFTETLERLGLNPASTWMIGDNFEADIRPAAALGMKTCWITPAERRAPGGVSPTARIQRLMELAEILPEAACTA